MWDTGKVLREQFYLKGFSYSKSEYYCQHPEVLSVVQSLLGVHFGSVAHVGEFENFSQQFWELISLIVLPVDCWKRIISVSIFGLLQ